MSTVENNRRTSRRWAAFAALAAAAVPQSAQAAQAAPPFEIPAADLQSTAAACRGLQGASPDAGVSTSPANAALDTGICLYHRLRDSTDSQGLLDTISVLQSAQTWGLDRSRQAAANLFEGLSSCRIAQVELQPALAPNTAQSPLFCLARKSALASFSRLRIQELRVSYESSTATRTESVDRLMTALTTCYDQQTGPLNRRFAAGCGVYQGLDDAGVAAVAARAYADISQRYLLGAAAPITAMFTRKKQMAESGLKDTQQSIDALNADSQRIGTAYSAELGLYNQLTDPLDALIKGYQGTFVAASAVLKQYDAWKQGLFEQKTPVVVNYTGELQTRINQIGSVTADVQAGIDTVNKATAALLNRTAMDASIKKNARAMCRAFFCELAVNQGYGIGGQSSYTKVCNRFVSPLCISQKTKLSAGGTAFTPEEFCKVAEFPATYLFYGLTRAKANTCWSEAQ